MSTLPIGSVTLKHVTYKFGEGFSLISVDGIIIQSHNESDKIWLYIKTPQGLWAYCLMVDTNGNSILHVNDQYAQQIKSSLPFFDLDNRETIKQDFLETFYALCHASLENPLHNGRGQVRMVTIDLIDDLIATVVSPKQSLAIWFTIIKTHGLYMTSHGSLSGGVLDYKYPKFTTASPYTLVAGRGAVCIPEYVLKNLGYVRPSSGYWTITPEQEVAVTQKQPEGAIPTKYLQVMNYSTRVPNELGFKTVDDKAGKFDSKFKEYYKEYVSALNTNSTPDYNPLAPVYLGLEFEFEVDEDFDRDEVVAKDVMPKFYPHGICKSDGSLYRGIELVTVPAVYEEHVKALEPLFNNFPSDKLSAEDTCGLHIHISRAPFSLPTQGRMIAFMNNPHNAEFLQEIGDREFNSYSHQDTSRSVASILRGGGERYNVLNLNNKATLEFRLFQGTTNFNTIKRSMQFCLAIAEYCKNLTMPVKEFTKHENFVEWIKTQRKVYPELVNFISPRKEIPQQYRNQQQSI